MPFVAIMPCAYDRNATRLNLQKTGNARKARQNQKMSERNILSARATAERPDPPDHPVSSSGCATSILIVDDDEMNCDILGNIFDSDHAILTASNGQEGLELFYEHEPHICAVLLDVVMPVRDGMSVLEELARHDVLERIPVFLITGETDNKIIAQAYDLGVMDVIPKPINPRIVSRRVSTVMELFYRRDQLQEKVDVQKEELERNNQMLKAQNLELADKTRQLEELNHGMIEALATATEFRSGESGEHVRRIHDITWIFLTHSPLRAKYSPDEIRLIAQAAIMHDVGKISIPDAILNKPGRLSADEFAIMKAHTMEGERLLEQIPQMRGLPFYDYALRIARSHHERWDGKGYPDGLSGEQIPLCAQIVSLADVFDALVTTRVYKPPFSCDEAVEMIHTGKCGLFNPVLLDHFREIEPLIRELYAKDKP